MRLKTTVKGVLIILLLGPILAFIGSVTPPSELDRMMDPAAAKAKAEQQKKAAAAWWNLFIMGL